MVDDGDRAPKAPVAGAVAFLLFFFIVAVTMVPPTAYSARASVPPLESSQQVRDIFKACYGSLSYRLATGVYSYHCELFYQSIKLLIDKQASSTVEASTRYFVAPLPVAGGELTLPTIPRCHPSRTRLC